jgi:hypothetical protein
MWLETVIGWWRESRSNDDKPGLPGSSSFRRILRID